VGTTTLSEFRRQTQIVSQLRSIIKKQLQKTFHDVDFAQWRKLHFKEWLHQKRIEEKEKHHFVVPYTDYLQQEEKRQFEEFWKKWASFFLNAYILEKPPIISGGAENMSVYLQSLFLIPLYDAAEIIKAAIKHLSASMRSAYLGSMRSFDELQEPLVGSYPALRREKNHQTQQHLAAAFYPISGFGYGRSYAYRQASPQGSVFKLVTGYEGLRQRLESKREKDLNPLTLIDHGNGPSHAIGYTEEGVAITRLHKGGLLPRTLHPLGKIDLLAAIEQSSNLYFAYLASDQLQSPNDLLNAAKAFGFGEKTGIELPWEYRGHLPDDLLYNRTGLYSFAIGQHTLTTTPLHTSVMLAAIGNGGMIFRPSIISLTAGRSQNREDPFCATSYRFQEPLSLIGIDFPLFTEADTASSLSSIHMYTPEIKRTVFLPKEIQLPLLKGMQRVVSGEKGGARLQMIRDRFGYPPLLKDYANLQTQLIGKTGTAEILHKQFINPSCKPKIYNHVWFGGISYEKEQMLEKPELVIVVLLRFGKAGRDAAPLAAQMVKKWREIVAKHGGTEYVDSKAASHPSSFEFRPEKGNEK